MILWTIVPDDVIFGEPHDVRRRVANIRGRTVECVQGPNGWQVAVLRSTDPRDFLDPALCPGAEVPAEWLAEAEEDARRSKV